MHSSLFSEYQSIAQFARGAATELVLAQSMHTPDDQVIFKIFNAINLQHTHEQERFQQEVYTLKQLHHPYILPLLHAEIVQGRPMLACKYMSHGSLRTRLSSASPGRIPLNEALPIIVQIGQALSYAHAWEVLHSAIKPENILFDANGHALLADFPIPTLLTYIASSQTPYTAPEQHFGQRSKESDQYALGCLAYEILTGQVPDGDAPVPLTQLVPGIPHHLDAALLKALATDPVQRHASVSAFIEALTALSLKVSALPPIEMTSEPELEQQLTTPMDVTPSGANLPAETAFYAIDAAPTSAMHATMNSNAPLPGAATMASAQWNMPAEPVYAGAMAANDGQSWQSLPPDAYSAQWRQEASMPPPPVQKRKVSRLGWVIIALVCVAVLTAGTVPMLLPLANNQSKVEQQKTATPILQNSAATETPEAATPTATVETTPTEDPAAQDTPVAQVQATTPTPVVTPTPEPTATPTPKPTATPTPEPTATPTPSPTPKATCCWLFCKPCK